jgi:hypothetical protein
LLLPLVLPEPLVEQLACLYLVREQEYICL